MSEEIQEPTGPDVSSDDKAQVVGPVGAEQEAPPAAEPAAEVSPGVGPGPEWVSKDRLSKQQSAYQRLLNSAEARSKQLEEELQGLKDRVRSAEMRGMTEAEQQAYTAQEQQEQFERWQTDQQRERYDLQREKYETEWIKWYVANGIPLEVLNASMEEAEDFEGVQAAVVKWALQQQAPAAPGKTKPPVTPTDQVQGGSVGAPPSMKYDEIFGGRQVDLREAEKYAKEVRKTGRLH